MSSVFKRIIVMDSFIVAGYLWANADLSLYFPLASILMGGIGGVLLAHWFEEVV